MRDAAMPPVVVAWRGLDDPDRLDTCSVALASDRLRAVGASQAADYSAIWQLDVGGDWTTRSLHVTVFGHHWRRSLYLRRTDDGRWIATAEHGGDDIGLGAPGLVEPYSLGGAVDCDLGLCPLTNVMPIRRLGLHTDDAEPTLLVMAWVEMPSLRVVRSEQWYSSAIGSSGRREIGFASGDFTAAITVDDDGIVVDYPGLAEMMWRR